MFSYRVYFNRYRYIAHAVVVMLLRYLNKILVSVTALTSGSTYRSVADFDRPRVAVAFTVYMQQKCSFVLGQHTRH